MYIRLIFLAVLLLVNSAYAEDGCWSTTGVVPHAQSFVVSSVLQKRNDAMIIKLIQSVEVGTEQSKALISFADKVRKEYPEYTVLDALVTATNKDSSVVCNKTGREISI